MVPTSGASTSFSSNAASTSGIGSKVAVSTSRPVPPGSAISIGPSPFGSRGGFWFSVSRSSRGDSVDRTSGDVLSHLHALKRDEPRRLIGAIAGLAGGGRDPRDVEDPSARGDDLTTP